MHKELLLEDEIEIDYESYKERKQLIEEFKKYPEEFFSKLRHFQPQIGCLNACSICSKYANCNVSYWTPKRIRNVVAALKNSTPAKKMPLIVWDRDNHISGVVFSYLDNDVGNYYYLYDFIKIVNDELGVKTRISTVGYSRHNKLLNKMHKKISKESSRLSGVRLSFTPYSIGWCGNKKIFSKNEYIKDMANFIKIYKPYYKRVGSGSRKFCIELRFKPLAINEDVYVFVYNKKMIIATGKKIYISKNENISLKDTKIKDPYIHELSLTNNGEKFINYKAIKGYKNKKELISIIKNNELEKIKEVTVYQAKNSDGRYYCIDPILDNKGNYGIYIYPKTKNRKKAGYLITERFFLNVLFEYKHKKGLSCYDKFPNATWRDVKKVIDNLTELSLQYKNSDIEKSIYIEKEIIPIIKGYAKAIKIAKYKPEVFFDKDFTIDTGTICNLGRAINQFKGLVSIENEPLTLNHERNYGKYNSTMTKEQKAWRLSCDYDDKIIIEELNLSATATKNGQTCLINKLNMKPCDENLKFSDINKSPLIPGQLKR